MSYHFQWLYKMLYSMDIITFSYILHCSTNDAGINIANHILPDPEPAQGLTHGREFEKCAEGLSKYSFSCILKYFLSLKMKLLGKAFLRLLKSASKGLNQFSMSLATCF